MLLLTVFGLGLFFTTVSWPSYFTEFTTWKYFLKCLTLISGVAYELPGVFENNPYKTAVNGSLWSMPIELRMYVLLAFIWVILRVMPINRLKIFKLAIVSGTVSSGLFVVLSHLFSTQEENTIVKLFFMFFTGATFFILKERIIFSPALFYTLFVSLLIAMFNRHIFFLVYIATLAYLLFFIACVPAGSIRNYNKLGDYSYGVYIYAFPVQQSIAALLPGVSVSSLVILSSVVTLMLAVLSWHLIEKHALKLKVYYVNQSKKVLSFGHDEQALEK
jgi:peptidoglycan/LPS O-acetylase OafA/YrhL